MREFFLRRLPAERWRNLVRRAEPTQLRPVARLLGRAGAQPKPGLTEIHIGTYAFDACFGC